MDELDALLSSDIWVRWRLGTLAGHPDSGYVDVLGPGETPRAEGRVVDVRPSTVDRAHTLPGRVARAVLDQAADVVRRGFDWDFREPGRGERLFAVRRATSGDQGYSVLGGEDTLLGTVGPYDRKLKQSELRPVSGTVCSYLPVKDHSTVGRYGYEAPRARVVDGAVVLARVFHDRDPDAIAEMVPNSGMIRDFDFGVGFTPGTEVAMRLLALAAAIIHTKYEYNDFESSRWAGAGAGRSTGLGKSDAHPAPGTSLRSARKQEEAAIKEHGNDRLVALQDRARRRGKNELADRLERRLADQVDKDRRGE